MKIYRIMAVLISGLLSLSAYASPSGKWALTPEGLPYYNLDQYSSQEDPYFLLGNYRLNLLTHASGLYEIVSGERVWARYNADPECPDHGMNDAVIVVDKSVHDLVGAGSAADDHERYEVCSGIGFTRYDYDLDGGIRCSRMISVMPSNEVNQGHPCFLLTVTIRNTGNKARDISYDEIVMPNLVPMNVRSMPESERPFSYPYRTSVSFRYVTASFSAVPQEYFHTYSPDSPFIHEVAPKALFVYSPDAFLSIYDNAIHAKMKDVKLRSGETCRFNIIIGLSDGDVKRCAEEMLSHVSYGQFGAYAALWMKRLPDFSDENDKTIRRELYWNAYVMESSAMYDSYFGETFVPEGAEVTYGLGINESNQLHIEAALPASRTNPDLAKSVIRYVMSHSDFMGNIASGNAGYGYALYNEIDNGMLQLKVMNAVAEYLNATGDYPFLDERIRLYPKEHGNALTVMQLIERYFMKLRYSGYMQGSSASYDNSISAMTAVSLPLLVSELRESRRASADLLSLMENFCSKKTDSFISGYKMPSYATDYLPYACYLLMDSVPISDRRECYYSLYDIDALDFELEYPLLLGLSSFDGVEVMKHFRKLSFDQIHAAHKDVWGQPWSATGYASRNHFWPLYLYYRLHK